MAVYLEWSKPPRRKELHYANNQEQYSTTFDEGTEHALWRVAFKHHKNVGEMMRILVATHPEIQAEAITEGVYSNQSRLAGRKAFGETEMNIVPLEGVGELRFGMTRDQTRKVLGNPTVSQKRNQFSKSPNDYYLKLGLSLSFDENDKFEAAEFSGPEQASYEGEDLVGLDDYDAKAWIENEDEQSEMVDLGMISKALGIAFYIIDGKVLSVGVAREGYW